jgi:hypothetical protein
MDGPPAKQETMQPAELQGKMRKGEINDADIAKATSSINKTQN